MFFVSLWGVKETFSEIVREYFISHPSRLAAEGGSGGISGLLFHKAKSAGKCFTTQSPRSKYRCYQCITF